MPDYRRMMDPGPNDPITPELLRQWNPGASQSGMGLDPVYSDRYLLDEGSQDTLGSLIQTLQGASNRTENIDAGLGRLQGLQDEQRANLEPLWGQGQEYSSGTGFLDQLKSGLGSVGGTLSSGLDVITPSQGTIDNLAMRLQNAHAIGTGRAPLWMQQQEHFANMGQQQELMQMRRAQAAHQMQQLEETKRQNQWEDVFKVIGSNLTPPQQIETFKTMGKQNPIAYQFSKIVNDKLLADFNMVKDKLGEPVENIMNKLTTGEMTLHDLAAKVSVTAKMDEEERHALVKEEAERKQIQSIADQYDKDPSSVSLTQKLKLKEYYTKHGKLDEELQQLHLANKNTRLGIQEKEIDVGVKQQMPQVSEEIPMAGGKTGKYVVDPQTMQRQLMTGEKKPLVEVNTGTKASEEAAKRYIDKSSDNFEKLRDANVLLQNIEEAKALIPQAKAFMGPFGETWMEGVKLLNNRLGTNIKVDNVKSAEELRSRLFTGVIENLRKMDPTPAVKQMELLQEAVGNLGTDPKALDKVLDVYGDMVRRKVDQHNKEVKGAEERGTKFPFDPYIQLPAKTPAFTMSKDEFEFAKGLHQQGISKDKIQQEILKRRGGK